MTEEIVAGLLYSSLTLLTPVLMVAASELLVEKSGILNLSIEGSMLIGAFTAFITAYYTGLLGTATLLAAISGVIFCLLFAFLAINLALDQMVTGLGLNLLAVGVTSYLYRANFALYTSPIPPHLDFTLKPLEIPLLSELPVVGKILFNHVPHTYLALAFVLVTWWVLFKTELGLRIRAMGEDQEKADVLGIAVNATRYKLLVLEGAVAGLAGALFSTAYYNQFLDNMTLGRGYIAIALVIFARWNPLFLLGGVFLFSFVEALQLRIQAAGLLFFPHQFALMLPYLLTVMVLIWAGKRVKTPSSLAKPFRKVR